MTINKCTTVTTVERYDTAMNNALAADGQSHVALDDDCAGTVGCSALVPPFSLPYVLHAFQHIACLARITGFPVWLN